MTVLSHPVVHHKLALLRDETTKSGDFRRIARELGYLVSWEAFSHVKTVSKNVTTPLDKQASCQVVAEGSVCIVSILRAGNALLDPLMDVLPEATVGFLGMARDESTLKPVSYYEKLPKNIAELQVIVVDPMLATAGTAVSAIDALKAKGVADIVFVCILACQKGIDTLKSTHPDVRIVVCACDELLNDKGYIVPGLGDCGDRVYGTV